MEAQVNTVEPDTQSELLHAPAAPTEELVCMRTEVDSSLTVHIISSQCRKSHL
jgi:hypothetical protein